MIILFLQKMLPATVRETIERLCELEGNEVILTINIVEMIVEDENDTGFDEAYVAVDILGRMEELAFHITRQTSGYVVMSILQFPEHISYML